MMKRDSTTTTGLKDLVSETSEAKAHALQSALEQSDDKTAERILLYAESLGFAQVYLQLALIRKMRAEKHG